MSITPTNPAELTIERAKLINSAMFKLALERDDIAKCPWSDVTMLREATLAEMTAAGPLIKRHEKDDLPNADGSRSISMICDDRIVAAIYTFLHYALPPAHRSDDEDYLILKVADRGYASFLICGVRELANEAEENAA